MTAKEFTELIDYTVNRVYEKASGFSPEDMRELDGELRNAVNANIGELRARLLVANQEMYGEYDRLAAEGSFRLNLCLPMLALGITAGIQISPWWYVVTTIVVGMLFQQGLSRQAESDSVVKRAVLADIIRHPVQSIFDRWGRPTNKS
jgi:hypothetical protein